MKKTAFFLTSFILFCTAFVLSHGTGSLKGEDSSLATSADLAWERYEEKVVDVGKVEAERLFKEAEKEILEERKIKLYQKAVRSFPEHYQSLFKLGWYLQKRNLRQMSADYYKRCIKANPNHFAAYNNLGNIYKDWRDYDKAVSHYEKAMQLNPGYALAPLNLGNLYRMQRRFDPAKKYYRKTLSIDPDNFWANLNLGSVLMVSAVTDSQHNFVGADPSDDNLNNAEFYFKRALTHDPGLQPG